MRLASFFHDGQPGCGVVVDSGIVPLGGASAGVARTLREVIAEGGIQAIRPSGGAIPFANLTFAPVIPDARRIICVGYNYRDHALETGSQEVSFPTIFLKELDAFVGHGESVLVPRSSSKLDFEGELAVIIGRGGRHIAREQALSHIAGYTCLLDGSVRDFQQHSVTAGKNFNRSSSVGPWMTTSDEIPDPSRLTLTTRVNGIEMQRSGTDRLIFDIPHLIAYCSQWMALTPGDIISTGTPAGVGSRRQPPSWLKPGDAIEIEITGIGILRNSVAAE
jgi:2-keto-4-pentenoate hydratase/2-oxohepta-3-ene-1,7-dioic acid hydratase in catechol pathway